MKKFIYTIFALLFLISCEKDLPEVKEKQVTVTVTVNGISQTQQTVKLNGIQDTCIHKLIPHNYDFIDTGSIMIAFTNNKPEYYGYIWQYQDTGTYYLDHKADTIHITGNVFITAKNEFGNNIPFYVNGIQYTDTLNVNQITVRSFCAQPLVN